MAGELASRLGGAALLALLAGALLALALALPPAAQRLVGARWHLAAFAALLVAGLAWLVALAAEADGYYAPGEVSRWEHATRSGAAAVAVAGGLVALAAVAVLGFAAALPERAIPRRLALPLSALACLALLVAASALKSGH